MKKHYLPVLISTICLLFSTMVFSAQPKIVVYTLSGGYELVKVEDLTSYTRNGWYVDGEEHEFTFYNIDGETKKETISRYREIKNLQDEGWFTYQICTVYSIEGDTQIIKKSELSKYRSKGWYDNPVIKVYHPDVVERIIYVSEKEEYLSDNWFLEPVCYLYKDGIEKTVIKVAEKHSYLADNYTENPICYIFSTDGRTASVDIDKLEIYQKLGWHKTPELANAAAEPTKGANISTPIYNDTNNIEVFVDSTNIKFDVKPVIINGSTMVPLRAIFESLGATIEWDNATKTIFATRNNTSIVLPVYSSIMLVNDSEIILNEAATIINGRTLVPVRAISEAFGCQVGWDSKTKIVSIINDSSKYVFLYASGNRCRSFAIDQTCAQLTAGWFRDKALTQNNSHPNIDKNWICLTCGQSVTPTLNMSESEKENSKTVEWLTDSRIQYDNHQKKYIFVFSLKDDSNNELAVPAIVKMKIINTNNETVYNKRIVIKSSDFINVPQSNGTMKLQYYMTIDQDEIKSSSSNTGNLYFEVFNENFFHFEESVLSMYNMLPIAETGLFVDLPKTVHDFGWDGHVSSSVRITEVRYSVSGDDMVVYFSGEKIYDSEGKNYSQSCKVGWKLYDSHNNVIESGTFYSQALKTGEKFINAEEKIWDCITPGETYKLELLSTD